MLLSGVFGSSCAVCRAPADGLCLRCLEHLRASPRAFDRRAAFVFEGDVRTVVLALKYRNGRTLAAVLAAVAVERWADRLAVAGTAVDTVTWAPTSAARRRHRGFDQAELLARAVARRLDLPCRSLLRRIPGDAGERPQTGLGRSARLVGPTMRARSGTGAGVLLVDDVLTTGATLAAGERALGDAGHGPVVTVAIAAVARAVARAPSSPATAAGSATR